PGGLAFFFNLLSQLRYIAAVYFLFSRHRFKWILAATALAQLFVRTAEYAMFHDLILWGSLVACFWWILKPRSMASKAGFLAAGILLVFSIQVVKREYRDKAWGGENPSL